MSQRTRSDLFLLKQYGFSDKYLDWLYINRNQTRLVRQAFDIDFESTSAPPHTNKDKKIQKDTAKFSSFLEKMKYLLQGEYFNNLKMLFKYDRNLMDPFIATDMRPLFFYLRGRMNLLERDNSFVAIVGKRDLNPDFIEPAKRIVDQYVGNNYVIVSGLAQGTDSIVHSRVLERGGKTLAVLPTNFAHIYPKENLKLAEEIFESGLALTAVGPLENTYKSRFLERNFYVSSLADVVVVVETSLRSGTMNTIHNARKLGKEVLFLPQKTQEVNEYLTEIGAKEIPID